MKDVYKRQGRIFSELGDVAFVLPTSNMIYGKTIQNDTGTVSKSYGTIIKNMKLYKSGTSTRVTSGSVVIASYDDFVAENVNVRDLAAVATTVQVEGGDSGGIVYQKSGSANIPMGIVSARHYISGDNLMMVTKASNIAKYGAIYPN